MMTKKNIRYILAVAWLLVAILYMTKKETMIAGFAVLVGLLCFYSARKMSE